MNFLTVLLILLQFLTDDEIPRILPGPDAVELCCVQTPDPIYAGAAVNGTIGSHFVLLDQNRDNIVVLDSRSWEVTSWPVIDPSMKVFAKDLQSLSVNENGEITVIDPVFEQAYVYNLSGKLLRTFKALRFIYSTRIDEQGHYYQTWHRSMITQPLCDVFSSTGMKLKTIPVPENEQIPLIKFSQFCLPVFINDEIYFVSQTFPIILVYSEDGEFLRHISYGLPNAEARFAYHIEWTKLIYDRIDPELQVPVIGSADRIGDDLLLAVWVNEYAVELVRVDTSGKVKQRYHFLGKGKQDSQKVYSFMDIAVMPDPEGDGYLCLLSGARENYPVRILKLPEDVE